MAEWFRFMPLAEDLLAQCMGYLGATLTQMLTRMWGGRVTQRCHNSPDGKRGYRVRVTSRAGSVQRIWGILKSQLVELSSGSEDGWICALRTSHEMVGRWKSQNRKNAYLSPYVEEPLDSKVIKSFVPELRSRKCFSCLEITMFYVYMLYMNIRCTFHTYTYLAMVQKFESFFVISMNVEEYKI